MLSTPHRATVYVSLAVLAFNAVLFIFTIAYVSRRIEVDRNAIFPIGSEYPLVLPDILVTMEDTENYQIYGSKADEEWVSTTAEGNGYIRLGKERRLMGISIGHEMHCIRSLRVAAAYPLHPSANVEHASHCLNYLRQYILCYPDLTLEKFDPLKGNYTLPRFGATHVCKDWRIVYDELSKALREDSNIIGVNDTYAK